MVDYMDDYLSRAAAIVYRKGPIYVSCGGVEIAIPDEEEILIRKVIAEIVSRIETLKKVAGK
jgi:NADH:ubiquinone oxidoreductase subunit D